MQLSDTAKRLGLTGIVRTIVVHERPDFDCWLGVWLLKRFMPEAKHARLVLVPAGMSLRGSEGNPSVVHLDTGGGPFDQHGKQLERSSSAMLLAQAMGVADDPALAHLLEMSVAVDNAEKMPPTSLHLLIQGFPRILTPEGGETQWPAVEQRVFEVLDYYHHLHSRWARAREVFERSGAQWEELENGIRICVLANGGPQRDEAFNAGADVVIFTTSQSDGGFYVGIQGTRERPVPLHLVAANLRHGEREKRGFTTNGLVTADLDYVGQDQHGGSWFLHDSRNLILCGSPRSPLGIEQRTKLSLKMITRLVRQGLEGFPPRS